MQLIDTGAMLAYTLFTQHIVVAIVVVVVIFNIKCKLKAQGLQSNTLKLKCSRKTISGATFGWSGGLPQKQIEILINILRRNCLVKPVFRKKLIPTRKSKSRLVLWLFKSASSISHLTLSSL